MALGSDVLDSVCEMWWPKLDEQVSLKLAESDQTGKTAKRPDRELLEEILLLARRNLRQEARWNLDDNAVKEVLTWVIELGKKDIQVSGSCEKVRQILPALH
jgi:hypothetical protein